MAGRNPNTTRPSQHISHEVVKAQAQAAEERKMDALNEHHNPTPNDGWRVQENLWAKANEEERKNLIYGMVMHDGAVKAMDILRFFNITKKEFEPFKYVHEMARAALKLKIQRNQMSIALLREDAWDAKFFLGRQFAEQVQNPAHDGVDTVEEQTQAKGMTMNIFTKTVQRDEEGNTINSSTASETDIKNVISLVPSVKTAH